jgi:hypothetical protein
MMQLAAHEVHDLHELTLSCVNSITNMALFINQAKDAELKSLLAKHFPYHIKDYNTKVEYLSRQSGAKPAFRFQRLPILSRITRKPVQT